MDIQGYAGLVGYEGLARPGYDGLHTLRRANFLGPVHIVRQTISNLDTQISRIGPYHRYEGLSIAPQKAGESRRINHIPIGIYKPYILAYGAICGYAGLKV